MVQQKEGKGSGDHISNAEEMRRAWKTVEARRTQAVREEKLQELFVTWEVKPMKIVHWETMFDAACFSKSSSIFTCSNYNNNYNNYYNNNNKRS